jgi:SSS family solute:Na+ symporter
MKGPDFDFLPGPDIYWWIVGIGAFSGLYAVLGGIEALIWTDVLQFLLMLSGALLALFYVFFATHTGPADWWRMAAAHAPAHVSPPVFSWDLSVEVTIVTAMISHFFWTICTHGSDQVVLQRYFSTTSLQAARRSYLTNVVADLTMMSLLALTGLAILSFYLNFPKLLPEHLSIKETPDKLFPNFLGAQLPVGCAGLIVAGFLCDAMQTLESGVNAMAAVVSSDFINRFRTGHRRLISDLAVARILAVVVTAAITFTACWIPSLAQAPATPIAASKTEKSLPASPHTSADAKPSSRSLNIVELMPKMFNLFLGPLAALFFIGMFLPHCSAKSAVPAVLCGLCVSIVWSWWREIFGTEFRPAFTLAIAVPCVGSVLLASILGALFEGIHPKDNGYCWWAVMRRAPEE